MKFILMCLLTFSAANAGISVIRALDWPYWTYHVLVISTAVLLYLINNILVAGFIRKRAPEFLSKDEVMPGWQKWELTAGTGIVPKWVSLIGMTSIAFFLASPFELVAWLLRTIKN